MRRYTSVPKKPEEEEVAVRAKGFDQELSTRDKRKQSRELQAGGASVTPPGSARAMPGLSATLKVTGSGAQGYVGIEYLGSLVKITPKNWHKYVHITIWNYSMSI